MTTPIKPASGPLGWKISLLWLALAVVCFQGAYISLEHPVAGLLVFGYASALVQLTNPPTVRRAFYFGLATGFLCYAPQLFFFFKIFNVAAAVLWLVLAFWIGLFSAIVCGCIRRWGKARAAWLIPIVWTGVEYFRSELYPLKFSWLNIGYALPLGSWLFGMYGIGFMIFLLVAVPARKLKLIELLMITFGIAILLAISLAALAATKSRHAALKPGPMIVGIQMEFPPVNVIPKMLSNALAKNTNAQIFVLSEYTLDGPVPDALKNWCREHSRHRFQAGQKCADPVFP
jgi:apolipoprotein N-acyltransferase